MKVKDEELKQNEENLTDLPLVEEQTQEAKGGADGHEKWLELNSLQFGTGRDTGNPHA